MPLWVSLIAANYDMRRYAASGDAGKRFDGAPCCGRRCLYYYFSKQLGQCGQILEISKGKRKEGIIRAGRMEGKKRIFSWGQTQQRRKVFGMLAAYFN